MKTTKKKAAGKSNTQDNILDIAERHFALYGFEGTSLRGIIKEAKVNVAAVAYHFGDKEELFIAVTERFAVPVVSRQLEQLAIVRQKKNSELKDVLLAFYEPPIRLIKGMGKKGEMLALFLGRSHAEGEPVFSLVDKNYAECRNLFIDAFKPYLPECSDEQLHWNFEFMLSLIVCFTTRQKLIRRRFTEEADWNADDAINSLVSFCEAGMLNSAKTNKDI